MTEGEACIAIAECPYNWARFSQLDSVVGISLITDISGFAVEC